MKAAAALAAALLALLPAAPASAGMDIEPASGLDLRTVEDVRPQEAALRAVAPLNMVLTAPSIPLNPFWPGDDLIAQFDARAAPLGDGLCIGRMLTVGLRPGKSGSGGYSWTPLGGYWTTTYRIAGGGACEDAAIRPVPLGGPGPGFLADSDAFAERGVVTARTVVGAIQWGGGLGPRLASCVMSDRETKCQEGALRALAMTQLQVVSRCGGEQPPDCIGLVFGGPRGETWVLDVTTRDGRPDDVVRVEATYAAPPYR